MICSYIFFLTLLFSVLDRKDITLGKMKDTSCRDGQRLATMPPKVVKTCFVELSAEERKCYDEMERQSQIIIKSFVVEGTLRHNYQIALSFISQLRQICNHPALCSKSSSRLLASNIEGN